MKEEINELTKSLRDVFITSSVEKLVQHRIGFILCITGNNWD